MRMAPLVAMLVVVAAGADAASDALVTGWVRRGVKPAPRPSGLERQLFAHDTFFGPSKG